MGNMRTVPRTVQQKISFFQSHLGPWSDHAAQIGITDTDAAEMSAATDAAREAYANQHIAQQQAQSATGNLKLALAEMERKGAAIILKVRAKAGTAGEQTYTLASISPPNAPSPTPAPGTPHSFTWDLLATGALVLKWKCKNPRGSEGTLYEIQRSVTGVGAGRDFVFIGTSGRCKFVDDTMPRGGGRDGEVFYRIIAVRSTVKGQPAIFGVSFGTGENGAGMMFQAAGRRAA